MSEEFDDDAQDIPAATLPKNHLINPKLIVFLVVMVGNLPQSAFFHDPSLTVALQVVVCAFCFWVKRKHDLSEASVSAALSPYLQRNCANVPPQKPKRSPMSSGKKAKLRRQQLEQTPTQASLASD